MANLPTGACPTTRKPPSARTLASPSRNSTESSASTALTAEHREAQILQTGLFYSAARFRLIEGSPDPAGWLEVFETDDPDPLHAYPRAASHTLPAPQIHPPAERVVPPCGHAGGQG
jgi:hypothetical protein